MYLIAPGVVTYGSRLPVTLGDLVHIALFEKPVLLQNPADLTPQIRLKSADAVLSSVAGDWNSRLPRIPSGCSDPQQPQPWRVNDEGLVVLDIAHMQQ
jgi:hypothetical protein